MWRKNFVLCGLLILIFVMLHPVSVFSFDKGQVLADIWNKSLAKLEKALSLLDEMRDLPDEKFLGKDKIDNTEKFNNIISDVLEIISSSEAKDIRENIVKLRTKRTEKEEKIRQYQKNRVAAPEEDRFLVTTRKEYDEKIQKLKNDVDEINNMIAEETSRLIVVLEEYGIHASYEELQGLLNTVTGYDIAEMYGTFNNIKIITEKLVTLMEESANDIEAQRKYYGVYALLLKTCAYMEASFIDKVETVYYPKLEDIYKQSQELLTNSIKQLESSANLSINQKKTIEQNIQSLRSYQDIIKRYQSYLKDQCEQVKQLQIKYESIYDVAFNTYRTLGLSSDLLSMIKGGIKELDMLINLQVPEIIVFDNENLEREFKSISEQLL